MDFFLQISNPLGAKPGLRFCTLPHSYSEATMRSHYPTIQGYMTKFNRYNVTQDAIAAVKDGYVTELEAPLQMQSRSYTYYESSIPERWMPSFTTAWCSTTPRRRTTSAG